MKSPDLKMRQAAILSLALFFPLVARAQAPQPTSFSVSPSSIVQGQCYTISVGNGANMTLDVEWTFNNGPIETAIGWPSLAPVSPGSHNGQANVWVGPCTPVGNYRFTAIKNTLNSPWVSVSASVTVNPPLGPSIASVSPSSAPQGSTVSVRIAGSNLCNVSLTTNWTGLTFSNISFDGVGGGWAVATFTISSTAPAGTATITLSATGGSVSFNFTIVQAPPSISSLSPASGYRGSNYLIVIDGQYLSGASITTTNPGIAVDNLNITDSRITAVFYISPSAAEGAATVSVKTSAGTATAPFTVTGPSTAGPPTIAGVQINDGKASIRPGATGALTVCGSNLETASLAVSSSAVSLGSAIYDRSSGCLSALISVQSSAEEDVVDLFATNPMGRAATRFAIGEEGSGILFVKPGLIAPLLVGESRSVQALVRFIEVVSTVIFLGPIVDVDQRFNRQIIKFRFIAVPIVFALVSTSPADGAAWSIEPPGSNVFSLATGGPSATNTIRGENEGSATLVVTESSTINKVVRRTIVVAQVVPPQPQPGQTVTLSVSLVDGPVSVERTNGIISGEWFRYRVEARDQNGSPVSVSVRFSSDFLRTDLGEQIPSTATVPGSATSLQGARHFGGKGALKLTGVKPARRLPNRHKKQAKRLLKRDGAMLEHRRL